MSRLSRQRPFWRPALPAGLALGTVWMLPSCGTLTAVDVGDPSLAGALGSGGDDKISGGSSAGGRGQSADTGGISPSGGGAAGSPAGAGNSAGTSDTECRRGYTDDGVGAGCIPWSQCTIAERVAAPGTSTSDVICEPHPALRTLLVDQTTVGIASAPGAVLLSQGEPEGPSVIVSLTEDLTFRESASPSSWAEENAPSPWLASASTNRAYYVDSLTNGSAKTVILSAFDPLTAEVAWSTVGADTGVLQDFTILTDGTPVALMQALTAEGEGEGPAFWYWEPSTAAGSVRKWLLDSSRRLVQVGHDAENKLIALSDEPPELFYFDRTGAPRAHLGQLSSSLADHFVSAELMEVTSSGAAYVYGRDSASSHSVRRVNPDGAVQLIRTFPSNNEVQHLLLRGENLVIVGTTADAWFEPLHGAADLFTAEFDAQGALVSGVQFGGPSDTEWAVGAAIAEDGRIDCLVQSGDDRFIVQVLIDSAEP